MSTTYLPPGVYTETKFESPVTGAGDTPRLPVLIGEGNEYLSATNVEVIRGSSAVVDTQVTSEDETGRAVVSVSGTGVVTLGAFNGSLTKFRVRNYPVVSGAGTGTVSNDRTAVTVTVNGTQVIVKSLVGATGIVELTSAPSVSDVVLCTYFFRRTDTLFTDDVSAQVSSETAFVKAVTGIGDVDSADDQGETLTFYDDVVNDDGEVVVENNNTLSLVVDGEELEITIPAGEGYTMAGAASLIEAAGSSTSLTATTFINNFGKSALRLGADQSIEVQEGTANAVLGLVTGSASTRRKTFYTFQGPIVDGTDAGVTTTDTSKVTVKVDGAAVAVASVDGASRAVTLEQAPEVGAQVVITYYANTYQDTFDYLPNTNILSVTRCGDVPDSSGYTEEADFVLSNDRIYWGTAWSVETGTTTEGKTALGESQVSGLLVDYKTYLEECEAVVSSSGGTSVASATQFTLARQPTSGNGRDTPLGTSLFQDATNGKIDAPTNRPDLVKVYWGYGAQDALQRGPVTVISVEGLVVTLAEAVPAGATVYASHYYNGLTDGEYTLTCVTPGVSGVGTYGVTDANEDAVYGVSYSTANKGSSLTGITIEFPSGSELRPDFRFEGGSGVDFEGPVAETVTVEFATRNATPAKYAVPGSGPYEFVENQSDTAVVDFAGTEATVDLANPMGVSGWDGGFTASLVGNEIDYTGGSGSVVGQSYTLTSDESFNLYVDNIQIPVKVAAGSAKTVADFVSAINVASNGAQALASAGGAATITLPTSVAGHDIPNYFVGWDVVIGNGAAAATAGQRRTVTAYNSSTRVATVGSNWAGGATQANDPFRIFNPDTLPVMKGATRFDGAVDLSNGQDQFRFTYVGNTSGSFAGAIATLAGGPYATVTDLVSDVQTEIDTAIAGAGAAFAGLDIEVGSDADGRLTFNLILPGVDASGYFAFVSNGIVEADSFAHLAGLDVSTAIAGGQTTLINAAIARSYTVTHTDSMRPHDRIILRNRILPGGGASLASRDAVEQCQLEVGSGVGLTKAGLPAGHTGEAGKNACVTPASILGRIGFVSGQSAVTAQPNVIFYDGTGAQGANDTFEFTLDGEAVSVTFTSSDTGTDTDLGPGAGTSNGSVIDQIIDAMAAVPGAPWGNAAAIFAAGMVRQEGAGIRITSVKADSTSVIVVGTGNANETLGFTDGQTESRSLVSVKRLVSALNANRHSTFSTALHTFTSASASYFTGSGMGIATLVEDAAGAEYLFLQHLPAATGGYGASSTLEVKDALVSSVVTDSWLQFDTGLDAEDGDGDTGEAAIEGFFVTSSNPAGSGSINDSILNDGVGQDGMVGQTYRDSVTGLTFTILPRGFNENPVGPWSAYPTGSNATLRLTVGSTFTTNANLPVNVVPGVELTVANMYNVGADDTAIVKTFERGGSEPANGDPYYVSYTYQKSSFGLGFFTKLSAVEAAYGPVSPDNPVSLAAYLTLINGAFLVGIYQVEKESGSGQASVASYRDAIESLEGVLPGQIQPDIIVPLRTDSTELYQVLKRSNEIMSSQRYKSERTSIVGMSGGSTPTEARTLAGAIKSSRMRLVYPDIATLQLRDALGTAREYLVDGSYLAAALAGSVVSPISDVATPWTNRQITGFTGLGRRLDLVEMNQVAQTGVTVFEEDRGALRVRHGLTTDMTNILTQLPTVTQIADEVQRQIRRVLAKFIGVKFVPGIASQVEGRLSQLFKDLQRAQIITAYRGIKAVPDANDPTMLNVTAFYSPVFPLNYIMVQLNLRSAL